MVSRRDVEEVRTRADLVEIMEGSGIALRRSGTRLVACCPFHPDTSPSFNVYAESQRYRCYGCGQSGDVFSFVMARDGVGFREAFRLLAERAGVRTNSPIETRSTRDRKKPRPSVTSADARRTWGLALTRAYNDESGEDDEAAYAYLRKRGLMDAWEARAFGILHPDMAPDLPKPIAWWPERGYRIVVPLVNQLGKVRSLQARNVFGCKPPTMNPPGSMPKGVVFACPEGRRVLRDESDAEVVMFGEGLSDHLALVGYGALPVVSVPGVSVAESSIGPWVRGRDLVVVLDADDVGNRAAEQVSVRARRMGARRIHRGIWLEGRGDACDALKEGGPDEFTRALEAVTCPRDVVSC